MAHGIDFKQLSLCDALDLALLIEQEAKERYEELAHQLTIHHNEGAARFFTKMVQVEAIHEKGLTSRRQARFPNEPRRVTREMIFDVEAPEYDDARAEMTVRHALEMALAGERKAYTFFDKALPEVTDREVHAFFKHLRDEEFEHQKLVESQIQRLPEDPLIPDDAFADEPVAH